LDLHYLASMEHIITYSPQIYNSSMFRAAATTTSSTIDAASSLSEKWSYRHCTLHLRQQQG